jgi:hypothetical protein
LNENKKLAVDALLESDFSISQALVEDVSYISRLSTQQLIDYNIAKHDAMLKLQNASRGTGKSGSEETSASGKETEKLKAVKMPSQKRATQASSTEDTSTDQHFEADSDDIKFVYDENFQFPHVKAATVDKLIERLTHCVYPGEKSSSFTFYCNIQMPFSHENLIFCRFAIPKRVYAYLSIIYDTTRTTAKTSSALL